MRSERRKRRRMRRFGRRKRTDKLTGSFSPPFFYKLPCKRVEMRNSILHTAVVVISLDGLDQTQQAEHNKQVTTQQQHNLN